MKFLFKLSFLFLFLVILSCKSVDSYNASVTEPKPVKLLHKDVDIVYKKLQKLHPNLYQYTSKETLDSAFASLKNRINKPMTPQEFYNELAPVVALVRQGHLSVGSPKEKRSKEKQRQLKNKRFEFNAMTYEYVEEQLIVKSVKNYDTLLVHSRILEVDQKPVDDLFTKYRNQIASDGYNTTFFNRVISQRFGGFYGRDIGFTDSIQVTFSKNDSTFTRMFRIVNRDSSYYHVDKPVDSTKKVTKLSKAERKKQKEVAKLKRDYDRIHDYNPSSDSYVRNFEFIGQDSSIAYMRISNFTSGKYKPFYKESFDSIKSRNTQYFILDLRGNTGGSLKEITELYSYFVDKPFTMINAPQVNSKSLLLKSSVSSGNPTFLNVLTTVFSPVIETVSLLKTFKKDDKYYYKLYSSKEQQPKENHYSGELYVLIDGSSFSASSILSTNLKATNRAYFVGEETGGAYNGTVAGMYKTIELPTSKVKMKIGLMQIESPYKTTPDGYGVKPDQEILPTLKALEAGEDDALDWVLKHINESAI